MGSLKDPTGALVSVVYLTRTGLGLQTSRCRGLITV